MTEALSEVCPHKAQPAELAMSDKRKLRWYQLSLSTVLATTTAIAIGFGIRSNENVACFVIYLAGSLAIFVACEWSMEWWRGREEAWQLRRELPAGPPAGGTRCALRAALPPWLGSAQQSTR